MNKSSAKRDLELLHELRRLRVDNVALRAALKEIAECCDERAALPSSDDMKHWCKAIAITARAAIITNADAP